MRCETCDSWCEQDEYRVECTECKETTYAEMTRAGKQEAFSEMTIYLDDVMEALRRMLELRADEWRSGEEIAVDTKAKDALSRAEDWLYGADQT